MSARICFGLTAFLVGSGGLSAQPLVRPTPADPPGELPPLTVPDTAVVPAVAREPVRVVPPVAPAADEPKFNTAAAKAFASKVQPILANRCADCHARPDHASGFKLTRIDPGINDPQGADRNLRAAVKWVTPAAPHDSPLLAKAVTPHGKATAPPLPTTRHPAFQALELWVHWACGPEGSATPQAVPPKPAVVAAAADPNPIRPAAAATPVRPRGPARSPRPRPTRSTRRRSTGPPTRRGSDAAYGVTVMLVDDAESLTPLHE